MVGPLLQNYPHVELVIAIALLSAIFSAETGSMGRVQMSKSCSIDVVKSLQVVSMLWKSWFELKQKKIWKEEIFPFGVRFKESSSSPVQCQYFAGSWEISDCFEVGQTILSTLYYNLKYKEVANTFISKIILGFTLDHNF